MELTFLPLDTVSIVAICIIGVGLVFTLLKKWLLTYGLIVTNFLVFVITVIFADVVYQLGFRPIYLSVEFSPQIYTIFTSMFVHGDILHLVGNMFVFFFMGVAFEQRIGWKKFLVIYLLSGLCGTLVHSFLNLDSPIILIGASGAIFGILGGFAFSYPTDEVVMPIPVGFFMIFRRIKVVYAAILFGVLEFLFVIIGGRGNTAHFAHIGGLLGGIFLAAILVRGMKTHTKEGKTIFYDSYQAQRPSKINISQLRKFADTPELKDMLKKIENETVPQVRDIWVEHFLEKAVCPKCKNRLNHFDHSIWCDSCGFKTKY